MWRSTIIIIVVLIIIIIIIIWSQGFSIIVFNFNILNISIIKLPCFIRPFFIFISSSRFTLLLWIVVYSAWLEWSTNFFGPWFLKLSEGLPIVEPNAIFLLSNEGTSMCGSRNYPYLPHRRCFGWNPPSPLEFPIKLHTFPYKSWLLTSPSPSTFPMTFHGVGMDIFWNHTILLLIS